MPHAPRRMEFFSIGRVGRLSQIYCVCVCACVVGLEYGIGVGLRPCASAEVLFEQVGFFVSFAFLLWHTNVRVGSHQRSSTVGSETAPTVTGTATDSNVTLTTSKDTMVNP